MSKAYASRGQDGGRKLRRYRIAAQSHLYARPLICGLEDTPDVTLQVGDFPSLADMLLCCEIDAALLSAVDLQGNAGGFAVIPAGCVASSGRSLTARIFSRVRPANLTALWVDGQAHTSRVLAQVLWSHAYNTRLDLLPFEWTDRDVPEEAEGVLLVGDKVVTTPPLGFDWQVDLGSMWNEMTGLPFVFHVWTASDPADGPALYRILSEARRRGQQGLSQIAQDHSQLEGWPLDMAQTFLTRDVQFDFGDAEKEGMEEFFFLAAECGAIDECLPVRYYKPGKEGD